MTPFTISNDLYFGGLRADLNDRADLKMVCLSKALKAKNASRGIANA